MADDSSNLIGLVQWSISNPEKIALALVILAGAWRWIKELWRETKDDATHETFTDMLMRENRELRAELRQLRRYGDNMSDSSNNLNDCGDDRESPR